MEEKCEALWKAIKDMDTIDVDGVKGQAVKLCLGYMAKDAQMIFKLLGAGNEE